MEIANLPAQLLHIASQFCSQDPMKGSINGVHVTTNESYGDYLRVASTNGHYAFRCMVPTSEHVFLNREEILIPGNTFKKKAPYAIRAVITDSDEARFLGGKAKGAFDLLEGRPCKLLDSEFPRQFDILWPEPNPNCPKVPVAFNSEYMRTICDVIAKYSKTGVVRFEMGDTAGSPIKITADTDDELKLEFLLMPVQLRDQG